MEALPLVNELCKDSYHHTSPDTEPPRVETDPTKKNTGIRTYRPTEKLTLLSHIEQKKQEKIIQKITFVRLSFCVSMHLF